MFQFLDRSCHKLVTRFLNLQNFMRLSFWQVHGQRMQIEAGVVGVFFLVFGLMRGVTQYVTVVIALYGTGVIEFFP